MLLFAEVSVCQRTTKAQYYLDSGGQPEFQSIPSWLLNGCMVHSAQIVVQRVCHAK